MPDAARIVFAGRLHSESFSEFVHHRAARLSVEAEIRKIGPDRAAVAVSGNPDLIDAFEMACSLGPLDCLVLDTWREEADDRSPATRTAGI
jgi:hypothetical protein